MSMCRLTIQGSPEPEDLWEAVYDSLNLSRRERQIVQLVLEDRKNTTIACRLGLKPGTVATYLERLYRKLGVRGRVMLVACVYERYVAILSSRLPNCAECRFGNGCGNEVLPRPMGAAGPDPSIKKAAGRQRSQRAAVGAGDAVRVRQAD